jgi:transcriptional regulator with XRE-family HTH domain
VWAEIGSQLRQGREAAGLSFEDIQDKTQIDTVSLRALESGDFNKVGSPFTVRSYIRAYAKQVGVEPTYLLKQYRTLEQTSVMPAVDPEGMKQTNPSQSTPSSHPTQGTGTFLSLPGPSPQSEDYDPYQNHPSRQSTDPNVPYDPYASMNRDEDLPTQQKEGRYHTGSRRTTTRMSSFQTPEEQTGASAYGDWITPGTESRDSRQRRVISDRVTDDRYDHDVHWDDGGNSREAWKGYSESAAGLEDATGWEGLESFSRRSDRSSRNPSGRLSNGESELHTPSRTRSSRERSVMPASSIAGPPALLDVDSTMPASRSGRQKKVAQRGGSRGNWLIRKRWILAVAVAILLIPVSVLAYTNMKDEPAEAPNSAGAADVQEPATANEESVGVASVIATNQTPTLSEYKLSEPDIVSFTFKANNSSSWIQIREQQNPDNGYIKDFTLQPGEEYPYNHGQDASNDIWVTIGNPEHVTLTINGQEVETTKSVRVVRD